MPSRKGIGDQSSRMIAGIRWLLSGPFRIWRRRLVVVSLVHLLTSLVVGLSTLALFLFLRAAFTDGEVNRFALDLGDLTSDSRVLAILGIIVAAACVSGYALFQTDRIISDISGEYATRIRKLLLELLGSEQGIMWISQDPRNSSRFQRVLQIQVRSASVAMASVLGIGQSIAIGFVAIGIAATIDWLATLIILPFFAVFAAVSQRLAVNSQMRADDLDQRVDRTRTQLSAQIDELATGELDQNEISLARIETDDRLFHEVLRTPAIQRTAGTLSAVFLFGTLIIYFVIVRDRDDFELITIIIYSFAARFAVASLQQVFRALTQVSRRLRDIEDIHSLIAKIDALRVDADIKHTETIDAYNSVGLVLPDLDKVIEFNRSKPLLVLFSHKPDLNAVEGLMSSLSKSSSPDVDFTRSLRVVFEDESTGTDLVSMAEVRAIEASGMDQLNEAQRPAFLVVFSHLPRLLVHKRNKSYCDTTSGYLIVQRGKVVDAGELHEAIGDTDRVRSLHRPNRKKQAAKTPK